jgi:hypothetical protein
LQLAAQIFYFGFAGGVIKITPIKSNPGGKGGGWAVDSAGGRVGGFTSKTQAETYARARRAANRRAGNASYVKVVKVK